MVRACAQTLLSHVSSSYSVGPCICCPELLHCLVHVLSANMLCSINQGGTLVRAMVVTVFGSPGLLAPVLRLAVQVLPHLREDTALSVLFCLEMVALQYAAN